MAFPYSSGDVLTAADLNASTGLVLIAKTRATTGTSISFDNVFTGTFMSYRIIIDEVGISSAFGLRFRLRASGTDDTSTSYRYVRTAYNYAGSLDKIQSSSDSKWEIPCIGTTGGRAGMTMDIYGPAFPQETGYSAAGSDARTSASGTGALVGGGVLATNTAYDGFTVLTGVSINPATTVKVYGYNNG